MNNLARRSDRRVNASALERMAYDVCMLEEWRCCVDDTDMIDMRKCIEDAIDRFSPFQSYVIFSWLCRKCVEILRQDFHASFIVCAIDKEIRSEILEPPMMDHTEERSTERCFWNAEYLPDLEGDACIFLLVSSEKIRLYLRRTSKCHWDMQLLCFLEYRVSLWIFLTRRHISVENEWDIRLQDTCLFSCDRLECIAEHIHMVVGDTRDRRDEWSDDIGGIETTTHSHFYHRVTTLLVTEKEKGYEGTSFEIRERLRIREYHFRVSCELLF